MWPLLNLPLRLHYPVCRHVTLALCKLHVLSHTNTSNVYWFCFWLKLLQLTPGKSWLYFPGPRTRTFMMMLMKCPTLLHLYHHLQVQYWSLLDRIYCDTTTMLQDVYVFSTTGRQKRTMWHTSCIKRTMFVSISYQCVVCLNATHF